MKRLLTPLLAATLLTTLVGSTAQGATLRQTVVDLGPVYVNIFSDNTAKFYTGTSPGVFTAVTQVFNTTDPLNFGVMAIPAGALSNVATAAVLPKGVLVLKTNGDLDFWSYGPSTSKNVTYGFSYSPKKATNVKSFQWSVTDVVCITNSNTIVNLSYSTLKSVAVPTTVSNANIKQVAPGYKFVVALSTSGAVQAWGTTDQGGNKVPAGLTSGVKSIAAGYHHAAAITASGTLVKWGSDKLGGLTALATLGTSSNLQDIRFSKQTDNNALVVTTAGLGTALGSQASKLNPKLAGLTNISAAELGSSILGTAASIRKQDGSLQLVTTLPPFKMPDGVPVK